MRVLVCGSRTWTNRPLILERLRGLLPPPAIDRNTVTIVHGAANGADRIAGELAQELGFTVEAHPANWGQFGRAAGPIRNREMLDSKPDLVIAFRDGESPGTMHCVNEARRRGILVEIHALSTETVAGCPVEVHALSTDHLGGLEWHVGALRGDPKDPYA